MEEIGSEVSHKIRAAIKAKLVELGAYVDDELPDYIMVMVANKRTRAQMDEDLQLFLSSNTKIFTCWLHTVLQKLQEVTVANFEGKKDEGKKKRKKDLEESSRSRKSSEEGTGKVKKHNKKHKEGKKSRKNKHKSKEKLKSKKKLDKQEDKKGERDVTKTSQDKTSKSKKIQLNDAVGKAILGDLKKSKKLKDDSSTDSSSSSEESSEDEKKEKEKKDGASENRKLGPAYTDDDILNIKVDDEPDGILQRRDFDISKKAKKELIEDEFNIEPLKPNEKSEELMEAEVQRDKEFKESKDVEATVSAPTEELLKEHNKLQDEKLDGVEEKQKKIRKSDNDSEDSVSPEEMRKQLLLSRAKKKLEEGKLEQRMKSNSPDVLILEETSRCGGIQREVCDSRSGPRKLEGQVSRTSHSAVRSRGSSRSGSPNRLSRKLSPSFSSDRRSNSQNPPSPKKTATPSGRPTNNEDRRKLVYSKSSRNSLERDSVIRKADDDKKRNLNKKGENLEKEKNLDKKEIDRKSKEREISSKRRPVSSRVVTIPDPEAPEIPSIVKVKPREFISKDKQANKTLILKAVADAEKSIATVHTRTEPDSEPKKLEALFTKNLRGKRYEKLAVTLSNIRKSPDSRDRMERRVSVDSEKSEKSRMKHDSSDVSDGARIRTELQSKKLSKSEDQFISSKTTIMEKNDKYIRCWLEGVEKAVKDDEMVNPSEMEDFIHSNYTDEENDLVNTKKEEERRRKRQNPDEGSGDLPNKNQKLSDKEIANLRLIPKPTGSEEGPQIVVTLDGLNSKTIKDLLLRNKETAQKPLLSAAKREKSPERRATFEKISDRFGRLNKVNDASDKEKKEKVSTEGRNRQLIAQLSEKFGKIDREFENRKRKRLDEERRYESRRNEKTDDRSMKYRKSERRSIREGGFGFYRRS